MSKLYRTVGSKIASQSRRIRSSYMYKAIYIIFLVLIAAAAIIAILEVTNTTHLFHKGKPVTEVITQAGTPNSKPTPNTSASNPTPSKSSTSGSSSTINPGGATDTQGKSVATTSPNQWITSKSGNITVKQPLANSSLQRGDSLIGNAKVNAVEYRLVDNDVGVVATGGLSVVGGKFSGVLHFSHHASTGRLDVFSTGANGIELNEIQIYVRF